MIIKNVTKEELYEARRMVNEQFENNIIWNNFRQENRDGTRWRVTLRVESSKKAGHRLSFMGYRMVSACWHVHGYFFEALLKIQPEAVIKISRQKITIDKDGGNWTDFNIGSQMHPLSASDACECFNTKDQLRALFKLRYPNA